ncbi:MAG TPA: 16S rRNA (cytosine(1402)-N(4))-methyltransferase RsmH [Clostridiales bacterium]|jgi:16S rRNA (cytosine1402-N4)-methyltransferase|nr:16S rRNA (cytosine(1402)-N(4))-methyltransferase RsmH [Clostridiales bacterium]
MKFEHIPVFLNEALDALRINPDGVYVDCTAGGGGHSQEILNRLSAKGRLLSIDRDPQAIDALKERFGSCEKVKIIHDNYSEIKNIVSDNGLEAVDGILVDLGVSSHQLDSVERGFSYHNDAPLDMRMSMEGTSAYDIVNTWPQKALQKIIYQYGEEKFAPAISKAIVKYRQNKPIESTVELAEVIKSALPAAVRREGGHPARKTFQAIRIEVNGEMEKLNTALEDMFDLLKPGGRLAVISFHSLEDRVVKQTFNSFTVGCVCPRQFPVCVCGQKPRGVLPFKLIKPTQTQIEENQRCRSAKLRCIEKN